ncbi:hypothetical protein M3231_06940 [Neobacillus mesonae]|nr:hypothetical protein [Neobacillus mesonae]
MLDAESEQLISVQTPEQWRRRRKELGVWVERSKPVSLGKALYDFDGIEVDAKIYPALVELKSIFIQTEFSCAGVSMLDEPEDHSLYAYVTLLEGSDTERFIQYAMERMGHRLLVTYEQNRGRYDLSSFFIGHNRSFCFLLAEVAKQYGNLFHNRPLSF